MITQKSFIEQYLSAVEKNLTLEQFAKSLPMTPKSVIRKRKQINIENNQILSKELSRSKNINCINTINQKQMNEIIKRDIQTISSKKIDHSDKGPRVVVITSAQNATRVFTPFLESLKMYCLDKQAELMIIPYRYRNPTSMWTENNEDEEWWDADVVPYLVTDYIQLNKNLRLFGPIKTQPTAKNPLSGYDSISGCDSAIFGHPKIQLKTIATPGQLLPKILSTTGAVTLRNYTDSKAGFQGDFHHSFAAIVVEICEDGLFHQRHIHADQHGRFYDLTSFYTPTRIIRDNPIAGLVTGDTHAQFIDPLVFKATYSDPDSIVNVLKPPKIVVHDIEDFYPRNHHHKNNPFLAYGKQKYGRNNVEEGLQITADFLDSIPKGIQRIIVKSNHDEAFDRWLKETDIRNDPENARFYHYMMYNIMKSVYYTNTGFSHADPFEFWCYNPDQYTGLSNKEDTVFLKRDQSYTIVDIEVGFHGDKGPNGARGNALAFAKIGPKTIIGHSHSPCINEGAYQVGLSARMNLEYVSGPSSWLQTHCIIYANGSRTLINIINGKWKK